MVVRRPQLGLVSMGGNFRPWESSRFSLFDSLYCASLLFVYVFASGRGRQGVLGVKLMIPPTLLIVDMKYRATLECTRIYSYKLVQVVGP